MFMLDLVIEPKKAVLLLSIQPYHVACKAGFYSCSQSPVPGEGLQGGPAIVSQDCCRLDNWWAGHCHCLPDGPCQGGADVKSHMRVFCTGGSKWKGVLQQGEASSMASSICEVQVRMQSEGKLPEGTPKKYPNAFRAYGIIARYYHSVALRMTHLLSQHPAL